MASEQPILPGLQTPLEEGEPVFILRARDSLAPGLAALWAALAAGDTSSAISIFADLNSDPAYKYRQQPREAEKVNSASDRATEMVNWRAENGLSFYQVYVVKRR